MNWLMGAVMMMIFGALQLAAEINYYGHPSLFSIICTGLACWMWTKGWKLRDGRSEDSEGTAD